MRHSINLRPATPADESLLFEVYAGSRAPELEPVLWSSDQKEAFLRSQFQAQAIHYRQAFPEAEYSVIVCQNEPVGRMWIHESKTEIRILDLALLPSKRGNGVGTRLLSTLIERAREAEKPIRVFVENYQRSIGLLRHLGFTDVVNDGVNRLLEWRANFVSGEFTTRPAVEDDRPFLFELYRGLRAEELEPLGWDDSRIDDFAGMQYDAQRASYQAQFPDAEHRIVMHDDTPVGRLSVDRSDRNAITLVDITLLPQFRNRGIGTRLLRRLVEEARSSNKTVFLSVTLGNPARRLYARLGFQSRGSDGVYERMEWRHPS